VQTFIAAEKTAGTWAMTDDYWPLWGENAPQALTSLKQGRLAVATNAPAFTIDRGYAFNGTTQFLSTGFVQATHATVSTGLSLRLAVYERTAVSASTFAAGSTGGGTIGARLCPRAGSGGMYALMNGTSKTSTATTPTSLGYAVAYKAAAGNYGFYKNGALLETYDPVTESTTSILFALYIGASNDSGTAGFWRASSVGFVCFGASLSGAQELAQYNNVQAFAAAVGANV